MPSPPPAWRCPQELPNLGSLSQLLPSPVWGALFGGRSGSGPHRTLLLSLMWQLSAGLAHLHSLGLTHGALCSHSAYISMLPEGETLGSRAIYAGTSSALPQGGSDGLPPALYGGRVVARLGDFWGGRTPAPAPSEHAARRAAEATGDLQVRCGAVLSAAVLSGGLVWASACRWALTDIALVAH